MRTASSADEAIRQEIAIYNNDLLREALRALIQAAAHPCDAVAVLREVATEIENYKPPF